MFPLSSFRVSQPVLMKLRATLSAVLMLATFVAPLTFHASAQSVSQGAKLSQSEHFVFYQGPNGEFLCREASLSEARELDRIRPQGLHPLIDQGPKIFNKGDNSTSENVDHLTINLLGTNNLNANSAARAAFIRAAQVWEAQIKSPITIYIDVDFGPNNFGTAWSPGVIGSTSTPTITRTYDAVRTQLIGGASKASETPLYNSLPTGSLPTNQGNATSITVAQPNARALGFLDVTAPAPGGGDTTPRPRIGFNSAFNYDFDPNDGSDGAGGDGIDPGKTDFEAVAVHEIGHALGFTSRAGRTTATNPAVWDIFRFRTGTNLGTFGSTERIMTADGLQFYFSGPAEAGLSTGGADGEAPGGDGRQSSHWRDDVLSGIYVGIMDPNISSGIRRQITSNDIIALDSFGYNLDNANPPPPPPPPPNAPANNDFVNAQTITGCTGSVTGTNVSAHKEPGEPSHSPDGNEGGGSVWYQWVAPSDGSVTITTESSNYDTLLAVYTGNAVNALTATEKNDDVQLGVITTSTVTFTASAGVVYRIAVDGWGGETGNIQLNWTQQNCTVTNTTQLDVASFTVSEAASTAVVNVTRINSSAAATIDYSTNDFMAPRCDTVSGSASAKCDYATSGGTVRFAAGEAVKPIVVSLVNDAHVEGSETFTITLTNPVGTSIGSRSVSTVTIQDNDTDSNATNPFLNNAFFVRQQYLDFLLREPDAAGFNDWQTVLNGCGPDQGWLGSPPTCDRVHVSSGFFRSTEFGEKGYWIYRFYESALGRRPAFAEFMPEVRRLSGLMSDSEQEARRADFISRFMQLPEFTGIFSGLTDSPSDAAAFVAKLEEKARVTLPATATTEAGQPPQFGRQELINRMANGQSAAQTMREFIEQKVVWDAYFFRAFVAMQYFGYLRRDPEPAGYDDWVRVLTSGDAPTGIQPGDFRHLIFGFVYSVEYRERFGKQ
ncbi:MAG TPA: NF038122 family metalloprotease [Pyrinomonadaceae bacterium]